MTNIFDILNSNKEISDYKVTTLHTLSNEAFFVHRSLETVRATDTFDTSVTVYVDHDGKRGDSTFSVYASSTASDITAELEKAIKRAKMVYNEPYTLPENEKLDSEIESNLAQIEPKDLIEKIANAVFKADCYQGGSINATEIFVYKYVNSVKNSRGIDKRETKYSAMVEAIPTWNEGESVELYEQYNFSKFDADELTLEIDKKMREVRDRRVATKPQNKIDCPVVLNAGEISSLVDELIFGLNFASVYAHANVFSKGDAVQKEIKGDPLNVTVCGYVEGSPNSAAFDADGTTLTQRKIIDNGRVSAYYGASRFAQYLKEVPTGNTPCVLVGTGTLTETEIKSAPYFECVSLSGLQVDIYNDYIGGEVRLAYYFDGEKRLPVTSVSMSGSLSKVLESIRFSENAVTRDAYRGPEKAMLFGISIL